MSTPPNFSGPGYFAGESPDGLTTVAGVPVAAQVQVLWRDSADPAATETLVAQTTSSAGGQWQITGINPHLQYIVRGRKLGFDDVTIVGAIPTRTDVVSVSGSFTTDPDTQSLSGQAFVEGGLPPYSFTRLDTAMPGIAASFDGRHASLTGFDFLPQERPYQFAVQVQTGNGIDQVVHFPIYAGLGTPWQFAAEPVALFKPTFFNTAPKFLFEPLRFKINLGLSEDEKVFIKLNWTDPSAFGNAFRIYRDTTPIDQNNLPPTPYALVAPATGPAPQSMQWIDTDVIEGVTYHYAVESYFGGESKITASKSITANVIPTQIGEYFFGGYYVGNITTADGTYAVIFAVEEADVLRQWKTANTVTPGVFSDTDGWANTQLLTADEATRAAHPAAAYCRAYDGAGFDDWYLASRQELLLPWTNRAALAELNMGKNTTYLWSSTQHPTSTSSAWNRRVSDGSESYNGKLNFYRVRPCRRLKLAI